MLLSGRKLIFDTKKMFPHLKAGAHLKTPKVVVCNCLPSSLDVQMKHCSERSGKVSNCYSIVSAIILEKENKERKKEKKGSVP